MNEESSALTVEERLQEQHPEKRILTIQSHVVHGYAGNKCSVFPLQLHGFEVDVLNSVQFSNHTGYKEGIRGYRLAAKDLAELYDGLKINKINYYSHVMSGYCGDPSFLRGICYIVKDLKDENPDLTYVCDPVLGDNGHYYVPTELCAIYRDEIFLLADIITPNAFELSQLSGISVETDEDCLKAIQKLHAIHPHIRLIVVTSGIFATGRDDLLYCFASHRLISDPREGESAHSVYRFEIPIIVGQYVGTGDVFTSLLVTWLTKTNGDVPLTICRVISSLQAILKRTHAVAFYHLVHRRSSTKMDEVRTSLDDFFRSKPIKFYTDGIPSMREKWKKLIRKAMSCRRRQRKKYNLYKVDLIF